MDKVSHGESPEGVDAEGRIYPRKFRVAHIITQLELGGAQRNTLHTVRNHDRSKFEVALITNELGILNPDAEAIPDTSVYYVPTLRREINPPRDLRAISDIAALLKKLSIDIVHTHSSKAGIAGRHAAKKAGVPVIVHTVHGWPFHDFLSPWRNALYKWPERACAGITDTIITVSDNDIEKGLVSGIGPRSKYVTVRSGIDCAAFYEAARKYNNAESRREFGIPGDAFLIGQVNSFKPGKNNLALVEIADRLLKRVPRAMFLLVGDGVQRAEIEKKIAELELSKHFILTGWRKDIERFVPMCDVITLTTLHEGLPQVCAQAMCCEKPMVMHAVDGIPEACRDGETGFLIKPGDTDGFVEKLCLLAGDPDLRRRLGGRGREIVYPEWDADHMVRRIEDVYDEILLQKGMTALKD